MPILLFVALVSFEEPSSRTTLLQGFRRSEGFLVVSGASSPEMRERMKAAAQSLGVRRPGALTFLEASEATQADVARGSVVLVGTPRSNPWIARIASGLPVAVDEKGIRFRGKVYDGSRDSLQLLYPSPFRAAALLLLITGNSDEAVLETLAYQRRGDFQIRREGATLVFGRFR
ncbi:MAG: hypothetical protein ACRD1Z_03260, partial [Vicinamibacteria bacterium]